MYINKWKNSIWKTKQNKKQLHSVRLQSYEILNSTIWDFGKGKTTETVKGLVVVNDLEQNKGILGQWNYSVWQY